MISLRLYLCWLLRFRRLHPVFVCRAPACQWPLLVLAHNYQPLLAQVGLFWFRILLIHLPCQQCRRLVCPPARLHHVLHLFPLVCQPHRFRHPFSSHSLLGLDSHRFLTKIIVSQILAGKFVDLAELLSVNLRESESEPQLLFDGRIVLSSTKRPKRKIDHILAWSEAFSIFSLILATHFPSRWRGLTFYKLLILRIYRRQFQGNTWLAHDRAFREHAAAARLTDWSSIYVQLFTFSCL